MKQNSNDSVTLASLLPTDRKYLLDVESKIGQITFTAAEKRELLKTINTPGWDLIKGIYVKQRLVQIAVAGLNVAQTLEQLMYHKGQAAEADKLIKIVEQEANSLRKEEDAKNKPQS